MVKKITNLSEIESVLASKTKHAGGYKAMYSSWLGGIVTDPRWMMVPVDDHLVHRGDGVFEAFKVVNGKAYLLEAHLDRLDRSAAALDLKLPMPRYELIKIISETYRAAGLRDALFRLYLSRGPGGFTTNPYESIGAQLYIVATDLRHPSAEKYQKGVRIGWSHIPVKEGWFATVKSCNYLHNVLMKKEAVDKNLDFVVSLTPQMEVAESSTENLVVLTADGDLIHPPLDYILRGCTMIRLFELAKFLVQQKKIREIAVRALQKGEVLAAREVFMVGTTLDVLPVTEVEGSVIGQGAVGDVGKELQHLLKQDQQVASFPFVTALS